MRKLLLLLLSVETPSNTTSDATSLFVKQADEAISIGPIVADKINPHVDGKLLIQVAKQCGADAIHPGLESPLSMDHPANISRLWLLE